MEIHGLRQRIEPLKKAIPVRIRSGKELCSLCYSLATLTMAAGYYSLGPIACHSLITLKWATDTARQSEAGWDVVAAERPGIYILGWTWEGWHGHGLRKLHDYYLLRATLGPKWGG